MDAAGSHRRNAVLRIIVLAARIRSAFKGRLRSLEVRRRRVQLRALALASDFNHIRADQKCRVAIKKFPIGYLAECVTHNVESDRHWRDGDEARQEFLCDRGRRWMFIVHHRDDSMPPRLVDLTDLWEEIRSYVQNDGVLQSTGQDDLMAVYRYTDTDRRIPLEFRVYPLPRLNWLPPDPYVMTESLGCYGQMTMPDADTDRYLVVIHAEGEEPDLDSLVPWLPLSPDDDEVTGAYSRDGVTYLRMAYTVQ